MEKDSEKSRALISVIIPVYNIPNELLGSCLNSVLEQTHAEVEVIVVNDCSPLPDNARLVRRMAEEDERLIPVELPANGGVSNARNVGLSRAKGEWISFVDADDYLEPTALESMLRSAEDANADVVQCNVKYDLCADGSRAYTPKVVERVERPRLSERDVAETVQAFGLSVWGKLYRRKLWASLRFPVGVAHFEDVVLLWSIARELPAYVCLSGVGYTARCREASASRSVVDKRKHLRVLEALGYACRRMQELFGDMPRVKKQLGRFIVGESFASREMYRNLQEQDQSEVLEANVALYRSLNGAQALSPLLRFVSAIRVAALKLGIVTYPLWLYAAARAAFKTDSGLK